MASISSTNPSAKRDRLQAGEYLKPGEALYSPNGYSFFILQEDFNLCLYQVGLPAIWSSDTHKKGKVEKALLQPDGDLVLVGINGAQVWSSQSSRPGGNAVLILREDGVVAITSGEELLWSTRSFHNAKNELIRPRSRIDRLQAREFLEPYQSLTSPNRLYRLIFQFDGNLVLYRRNSVVLWASGTDYVTGRSSNMKLVLERDGNLQLYTDVRANLHVAWSSKSGGNAPDTAVLMVLDDGNVVIVSNNKTVWATDTKHRVYQPRTKVDRLEGDQMLEADEFLISPNGQHKFGMSINERSASIYLYRYQQQIWNLEFPIMKRESWDMMLELEHDATLKFSIGNTVKWSVPKSHPGGSSSLLLLDDDGNLTLVSDGKLIWSPTKGDSLYYGDRFPVNGGLIAGDYRLNFTSFGHFRVTNKAGESTFYYSDTNVEGASFFQFSANGAPCFLNDRLQEISAISIRRRRDDTFWNPPFQVRSSRFTFHDDGWGRVFINDNERWSFADLASGPFPFPPGYKNTLNGGGALEVGEEIISSNGQYRFRMRNDGSAALTDKKDTVLWATGEGASGQRVVMDVDGNLALNLSIGWAKMTQWSSNTSEEANGRPVRLIVQNDGNLVIYADKDAIWATNTSVLEAQGPAPRREPATDDLRMPPSVKEALEHLRDAIDTMK